MQRHFSHILTVSLLCASLATWAFPQNAPNYTYGNRPIDLLPKSETARAEESRGWDDPELATRLELALHLKDLFRVSAEGLERLCVIEARRPEGDRGALRLALVAGEQTLWQQDADWIGANQRMRPAWLPVRRDLQPRLVLLKGADPCATATTTLGRGAPAAMIELSSPREVPAVDAGIALLPANELAVAPGAPLQLRVALTRPAVNPLRLTVHAAEGPPLKSWTLSSALVQTVTLNVAELPQTAQVGLRCELLAGDRSLASQQYKLHVAPPSAVQFGAKVADLRYTLPVADGDRERSWDELWGKSEKRDVVVSFPGSAARLVFWRGASYVPCWALPEAWLTYEWLEAEPYFFGADDCVEPLQDRDCKYSQVEIVSSTPARTIVRWRYALTDFQNRNIRDEHAEEIWTLYPDGVGTRFLRGFYEDGWHENQEFIVVNRPGRRASQALDPQALTLYSPTGEEQTPVWPKPGFSVEGWPQVITLVNLGAGPRPFMVTPDEPQQVKVWAKPYVDKLDIFNSYPHWPVTRGMRTSWLDDPRQFARPTHSNLANLVNRPVRETETEKDWVWLVGVASRDEDALAAARSWLRPGTISAGAGVTSAAYDQAQRDYLVQAGDGATVCEFGVAPPAGGSLTNPAFVLKGWTGPARVEVPGAVEVLSGQEAGQLVVWVRGQFARSVHVRVSRN